VSVRLEELAVSVRICVENGGPAIPTERLPMIFEPFERGTTTQEGTGLGLYIVREIARAHGGYVDVQSDSARTTFRLFLPLRPAKASH
jgi:signal transduction histidine kinase